MLKVTMIILITALLLTGCAASAEQINNGNTQPAPATTATDPTATTEAAIISADEAKAIALKDAGLTADQVTGLRAEFDRDDRRPEWEVDFRYDGFEYDYTIHAETGKILEFDKDRED